MSEPIPVPTHDFAQAELPRHASPHPGVRTASRPATEAETVATLQSLMDTPPTDSAGGSPGAAIVRNEHIPVSRPFRLATRSSRTHASDDPALQNETLSALETMMADDAQPAVK
jgi:hypothetical protein